MKRANRIMNCVMRPTTRQRSGLQMAWDLVNPEAMPIGHNRSQNSHKRSGWKVNQSEFLIPRIPISTSRISHAFHVKRANSIIVASRTPHAKFFFFGPPNGLRLNPEEMLIGYERSGRCHKTATSLIALHLCSNFNSGRQAVYSQNLPYVKS